MSDVLKKAHAALDEIGEVRDSYGSRVEDLCQSEFNAVYKALYLLEEKEKGVKPIWLTHGKYGLPLKEEKPFCGNCEEYELQSSELNGNNNYCPNCGTKIDWSDNDEC